MKLSTAALKFINEHNHSAGDPAPNGLDDLVQKIGAQLGAVEEVTPFGVKYDSALLVKVVACEDHPDSDHLHLCKVDDGGKVQDVDRDENGHVQVVCGATNVRAGMTAVWLPPGAAVPATYFDPEKFVLGKREIRGVLSNGMLASAKELGLGDDHNGILEVDGDHAPGTSFADAYHTHDDVIIDIENKMFTHRPDCFGYLGVAREIEGLYGRPYKSPEWYKQQPELPGIETDELQLEVQNEIPDLVPRFTAIALRGVQLKPSPVWLQVDLARVGSRPINNIVDYTNWYMLLTGQPLHAYDYDKVKALSGGDRAHIVVRKPYAGEKLKLLNGKEIEPREDAILIATDKQAIGLGGVMGGADTEVDEHTTNIILESASFDMYSIRRTSMHHGVLSDAVTRFNKGQSPLQNLAVLGKIVNEIRAEAGGKVASPLIDNNHVSEEAQQRGNIHPPVTLSTQFINERLGLSLSAEDMQRLLTNVECQVGIQDSQLTVGAPFWRTDIEIPEDVVEEVGRLYGYDHLPLELPRRSIESPAKDRMIALKNLLRHNLAAYGANEVLSYSFVHGNLLDKVGQSRDSAFQVGNALSPDLQYYRLSLVPSLLDKVHPNVKAGYQNFALFEMGSVHDVGSLDDQGLPIEFDNLGFVYTAAKTDRPGAAYYEARQYLDALGRAVGLTFEYRPLTAHVQQQDVLFDEGRSAVVFLPGTDDSFGVIGELKPSVRAKLKLPEKTAAFEIGVAALLAGDKASTYRTLPRFPAVEQDLCLKVPARTSYADVFAFVAQQISQRRPEQTYHSLAPLDIYQREDDAAHKQITLRLQLASFERTLTDQEVAALLNEVAVAAASELQAERI
ncbi:MAG TPA: phenylalanine--tRNA ligase subunit beta [Candidatus Saccharimonadales bacterium]|nr:phenylalanine--tRNA ligase subunit beta [Candidatus Saccharimonadales bacterium]